jgi:hypothetical protein
LYTLYFFFNLYVHIITSLACIFIKKKTQRKRRLQYAVKNWPVCNVACYFLRNLFLLVKMIIITQYLLIFFSPRTRTWNRFWKQRRTRRPRCDSRYPSRTDSVPRSIWHAYQPYLGSWTKNLTIMTTPTTDHRRLLVNIIIITIRRWLLMWRTMSSKGRS